MKQKISIAAERPTPKDLSRNHYTTLGFGNIFPIFVEETVNKDKFNIKMDVFARAAAMYVPNFSNLNIKVHGFYVPFRYVWSHFEDFKEGLPSWLSSGAQVYKNVPCITNYDLTDFFIRQRGLTNVVATSIEQEGFDFRVYDASETEYKYYKFTVYGKQIYHIFTALGYRFNFYRSTSFSESNERLAYIQRYSLLPLLCYLKVFLDYYIPSQLQPSSHINQLLKFIHDLTAPAINIDFNSIVGGIYDDDFADLLQMCIEEVVFYYPNNYFTSAWQTPNEVVTGLQNIGRSPDDMPIINGVTSQISADSDHLDSVTQQPVDNQNYGVSPYNLNASDLTSDGLSFLQKFARFVRRSNFAGSRSVERILARFGVAVDDFNLGMCRYLGSDTIPVEISDVTVTGSTEQAGDLAGKSWAASNGNRVFKCDCDLAGYIIFTASIDVPSAPVRGVRRRMFHLQPLDYYTPELDGGQMQAISQSELYANDKFAFVSADGGRFPFDFNNVFGFTPRYSEYKTSLPEVTGDFDILTLNANIDPYIMPRRLVDEEKAYNAIIDDDPQGGININEYFTRYVSPSASFQFNPTLLLQGVDMSQFNRIFKDTTGVADPFICDFDIKCIVNSVTKPLNESAELIGRGKELDFETNGKHL